MVEFLNSIKYFLVSSDTLESIYYFLVPKIKNSLSNAYSGSNFFNQENY